MKGKDHKQANQRSLSKIKEDMLPASMLQNMNNHHSIHDHMTPFFQKRRPCFLKNNGVT